MSKIEWTDLTWNPIAGCNDVSEGCRHCYARGMAKRLEAMGSAKYAGLTVLQGSKTVWTGEIAFDEKALLAPLLRKTPTKYFVNSMSDLFHPNVTDEMRDRIFAVMALCPQHTFQVLTKRPERMLAYSTRPDHYFRIKLVAESIQRELGMEIDRSSHRSPAFLAHVQLGVSVEDQKAADVRIPLLLQTPAAVRFISGEPLLGDLDLENVMDRRKAKALKINCLEAKDANPAHEYLVQSLGADYPYARIDWVICGGESGHGARPMHPDWARGLRDQCVAAGIPFFFKQWGEHLPYSQVRTNDQREAFSRATRAGKQSYFGACVVPGPSGMRTGTTAGVRPESYAYIGKKLAGDLLDGRQWHQFPEVRRE